MPDLNELIEEIEQHENNEDMHFSLYYVPDCYKEEDE